MKYKSIILPLLLVAMQLVHAQLYVQSLATLNTTGNAVITLQNMDLICNGALNQAAGAGTFVFTGTGNNTINGASIATLDKLEIAKTNGGKLFLSQDVTIGSAINFTSGLIDLNGNKIVLQPTARLNTESETAHITGTTGSIEIGGIDASDLPVYYNAGNLGAAIIANQNLGTLQVSRSHKPIVNPANASFTGIQRSYIITPTNDAGLNATLRFYYLDAELNGKNENTLTLWRSDDGISWTLAGADSHNTTDNYVEKAGITSFSIWTLTDINDALPVVLTAFKATCQNSYTLLQWQTVTEENAAAFIIEKSSDGSNWADIETIAAQNNPSGAAYSYEDMSPQPTAFYRLKMVDKDGKFTYSPVFSGGCNDLPMPFTVYPNPVHNEATVRLSARQNSHASVQLYSSNGQLLATYEWHLSTGINSMPIAVSNLAAGIYMVRVLLNGEVLQTKLLKE
jgi:hypothetical protein